MKVAFHTLGCKVNSYESQAMLNMFEEAGYEEVDFKEVADVYVVNTCTVTNTGDSKSRQMIRKAIRKNPQATVCVVGCYSQVAPQDIEAIEGVSIILGTQFRNEIVDLVEKYQQTHERIVKVSEVKQLRKFEDLNIDRFLHTRAYLKIQDGCNNFCTYCIIPYARGRVRSRNIESVLKEVHSLAEKGYKEVVLTGIHLSSYGVDFPEEKKETLLSLIRAVHEIEGIQRIRLGSLEPGIVTREFAEGIAALPKVCPHFHLSLQSGCDETLERMNRRYRSGEYRERCELLREVYGNPALTTDVIVGFPQESEEEFQKSYDFVDGIHFYETHIFKYSRRQGTKAAAMDGQLTEAEKARRSEKMIEMHHRHASDYEKSMIGKELEVLIEEEYTNDGRTWYLGHSREYIKTAVPKSENYGVNDIIRVKAERFLEEHIMTGEVVK